MSTLSGLATIVSSICNVIEKSLVGTFHVSPHRGPCLKRELSVVGAKLTEATEHARAAEHTHSLGGHQAKNPNGEETSHSDFLNLSL